MSAYPEDEFDLAARERGPRGVHRRIPGRGRRMLPYLAVLVAAPLLAWGLISALSQDRESAPAADGDTSAQTAAGETAAATPSLPAVTPEPTTPAPTTPAPTTAAPEYSTPISVLNGANRQGIAARSADRLVAAGFTDVDAANYTSPEPAVSTVFYRSEELEATARAVAEQLGIGPVTPLASASNSVVVVLRPDFQE